MKKINWKQLLLNLSALAVLTAATVGVTQAVMRDDEVMEDTISMGTINLQLGDQDPVDMQEIGFDLSDLESNEQRTFTFDIKSTGSGQGNLSVQQIQTNSSEGENPEPETNIDEADGGEVDGCVRIKMEMEDDTHDPVVIVHDYLSHLDVFYDLLPNTEIDEMVNSGTAQFTVTMDSTSCGNEAMGDLLDFELVFKLEQA